MDKDLTRELLRFFEDYVTEHKRELIDRILDQRTRHVTVVLEDIFKPHNASAVMRTCECMGIQDIHLIEDINDYVPNPYVTRGAVKWLSLFSYKDANSCIDDLRNKGYRIIVTSPQKKAKRFDEFDLTEPFALVFGTEFTGVSESIKEKADDFIYIPMVGFTESLNISVSAAIILEELCSRIRASPLQWKLTAGERDRLRLAWYKNIVKRADLLEQRYLSDKN